MTYIATPKLITILGVDFKSYLTEQGEVVFSQRSAAQGFGYANNGNRSFQEALKTIDTSLTLRNAVDHTAEGFESDTKHYSERFLPVQGSTRPIKIITKSELTWLVDILAERGNDVAKSMQSAGAAVAIQMAVDEAYGVERDRGDYISSANDIAKVIAERRAMLRAMSGRVTNPLLHCNVYAENNLLVYGDGYTRDNYDLEDADIKHNECQALELMQAGLKMAGLPMSEVIKLSHDMFRLKFRKQTREDING